MVDSVGIMIPILQHPDKHVRGEAASFLGVVGERNKKAIEALVRLVVNEKEDPWVRCE